MAKNVSLYLKDESVWDNLHKAAVEERRKVNDLVVMIVTDWLAARDRITRGRKAR